MKDSVETNDDQSLELCLHHFVECKIVNIGAFCQVFDQGIIFLLGCCVANISLFDLLWLYFS